MQDDFYPVFTLDQVREHSVAGRNCWIVVENKVYDVSSYLKNHPGGADLVTKYSGKDATLAFYLGDQHLHKHTSRKSLRDLTVLCIGKLHEADSVNWDEYNLRSTIVKTQDKVLIVVGSEAGKSHDDDNDDDHDKSFHFTSSDDADDDESMFSSDFSWTHNSPVETPNKDLLRRTNAQNIASRIILFRRFFPELYGELLVKDYALVNGIRTCHLRKSIFHLSGGYLRLYKPGRKADSSNANMKRDVILTYFRSWESRRVKYDGYHQKTPTTSNIAQYASFQVRLSSSPPEVLEHRQILSSSWALLTPQDLLEEKKDQKLLSFVDWTKALDASSQIIKSFCWDELQRQLSLIADMLYKKLCPFLPVVPIDEVITCLEQSFDLNNMVHVLEIVHALIDTGLLLVISDGFCFSNTLTLMMDVNCGGSSNASDGTVTPRCALMARSKTTHNNSEEKENISAPVSYNYSLLSKQEKATASLGFVDDSIYAQLRDMPRFSPSSDVTSIIGRLVSNWRSQGTVLIGKRSRLRTSYQERTQLRKDFDSVHMAAGGSTLSLQQGKLDHSFPCYFSNLNKPQPFEIWPQSPLLLRPSPNTGMVIRGIRFCSSRQNKLFLPGSGFCGGCTLPINNGKEQAGKSLVIDFESNLFVGTFLIRIRGAKSAVISPQDEGDNCSDYFAHHQKRMFQVVVRGYFKKAIPIVECSSGQIFASRLRQEIPRSVKRAVVNQLSILMPSMCCSGLDSKMPCFLSPLSCCARSIIVKSKPAATKEFLPLSLDENNETLASRALRNLGKYIRTPTHVEDNDSKYNAGPSIERHIQESRELTKSLLSHVTHIGPFFTESGNRVNQSSRRKFRKQVFDKIVADENKLPQFNSNTEYTFEFASSSLHFDPYHLDNFCETAESFDLGNFLTVDPLQLMAVHSPTAFVSDEQSITERDQLQLDWLWSFDLCMECDVEGLT